MTDVAREVLAFLEAQGIKADVLEHAPVFTMAECAENDKKLDALAPKNYFLTTKNHRHFYLCIVRPNARLRTADISHQAGSSRLSFGSEEEMKELLRVHPGAVSPLGLMFDAKKRVQLLADEALKDEVRLAFHPCDNAATVAMSGRDFFETFLNAVGHTVQFVGIHDFLE